jgi:hypothetical protein
MYTADGLTDAIEKQATVKSPSGAVFLHFYVA